MYSRKNSSSLLEGLKCIQEKYFPNGAGLAF